MHDVLSADNCEILLENGKIVDEVGQRDLETVIPRQPGAIVMVVGGRHQGTRGRLLEVSYTAFFLGPLLQLNIPAPFILQRDSDKQRASVRIVGHENPVNLSFEDICEYLEEDDHSRDEW